MLLIILLLGSWVGLCVPPALAKGATAVTVSGPGVDHVLLEYTRVRGDVDLGSLSEASGFYGIFGDGQLVGRPSGLSDAELGPRYELRWDAGEPMAVSYVYPFAEGGAWAEVPLGQQVWDVALDGGWSHGGQPLRRQLVALGATQRVDAGPATADAGSDARAAHPDQPAAAGAATTASELPVARVGTGVAVAVLLGVGAWLARRRRTGTLAA